MMIEQLILEYLISKDIDGIEGNVFCETPINPPSEYILIERTSGSARNKINQCMLAVQSISMESLYRAMVIDNFVVDALEAVAEELTEIFSCRLNTHYNFPNTTTKEYRYQAVFDIHY